MLLMKRLVCLMICLCLLAGAALCESTPILYKATNDRGDYIYLLGTMHVVNDETFPIRGFDALMDEVDTVVLELDGSAFELVLASRDVVTPLRDVLTSYAIVEDNGLSEALLDEIRTFFEDFCGETDIDTALLRRIPPYLLYSLLLVQTYSALGYDVGGAMVDLYVYEAAKERGYTVIGAESAEEQLSFLDDYFGGLSTEGEEGAAYDEDAFRLLINNTASFDYALGMLCSAYNAGSYEILMATTVSVFPRTEIDAGRNARFFEVAQNKLDNGGKALIAVGLYHVLCEEDGLVKSLTDAGYHVERVNY